MWVSYSFGFVQQFSSVFRQNGAMSHQQQLLLLLPSLRQAEGITRKFWVRINQERRVTMNKLLLEMLESLNR